MEVYCVMVYKNRHFLTLTEDLLVFRKIYNCYGRLICVPEDLLNAPEHFRNCSGALS